MAGRRFQSTPSARRATTGQGTAEACRLISIHALREEGDPLRPSLPAFALYFNPRPPRGGRLMASSLADRRWRFQSTPSARRATRRPGRKPGSCAISIHALREEGDSASWTQTWKLCNFNPRPPRGGRPAKRNVEHGKHHISIHALREEGDPAARVRVAGVHRISIHALREEGDPSLRKRQQQKHISIHALREEGDVTAPFQQADAELFQSTPSARRATALSTSM